MTSSSLDLSHVVTCAPSQKYDASGASAIYDQPADGDHGKINDSSSARYKIDRSECNIVVVCFTVRVHLCTI